MKSLKTRVATGALAGAMALSLAVPAFAASTTKVTATYAEIPIDVTVPTAGTATLNPMGMPVTLLAATKTAPAAQTGEEIATVPLYVQNNMSVKLSVRATVSTITKGVTLTEGAAIADTEKAKKANVYLQMVNATDEVSVEGLDEDVKLFNDKGVVQANAIAYQAANMKYSEDVDATTDGAAVVFLKGGTTAVTATTGDGSNGKATMAELNAKTTGTGDDLVYNADAIGIFALLGDMVDEPENAKGEADPWVKTDSITATIAWTFGMVKEDAGSGGGGGM